MQPLAIVIFSIFNAFLEVGSLEGIQYSADASGFPGEILNNLNFADWSDTEYASGPAEPYYTFKEGFQEITLRMMEEVLQSTRYVGLLLKLR